MAAVAGGWWRGARAEPETEGERAMGARRPRPERWVNEKTRYRGAEAEGKARARARNERERAPRRVDDVGREEQEGGGPVEYVSQYERARRGREGEGRRTAVLVRNRIVSVSATGDRPIWEGRRAVPGPRFPTPQDRTRRSEEEEDRDTIRDGDGRTSGRTDVGI